MKRLILSLQVFLFAFVTIYAQANDLSEGELNAFKVQCQEQIDAFQMALEIIADKEQPNEIKDHYIQAIPDMFIGKGDAWTDKNGGKHAPVKMQVSSIDRYGNIKIRTPSPTLKQYLQNLRNLPYTSVEIKKAQTCIISNLYKVNKDLYMGTCTFFQYFTGTKGEVIVIKDYTQKDVDIYIQRIEDGSLGTYWDMKFGDINVTETQKR